MKTEEQLLRDASKLVPHTRLIEEPYPDGRPSLICQCLNASTAANVTCMMVLMEPIRYAGAFKDNPTYHLPDVYQNLDRGYHVRVPIL